MNKKVIISTVLALTTALTFPLSAMAQGNPSGTFVQGFVYDAANGNAGVPSANVSVTCNSTTLSATTNAAGKYAVSFDESACDDGDTVTVNANATTGSGQVQGNGSGEVGEIVTNINVAVVNVFVSQVPEFSLVTGAAALLTSGGTLFAFRRRFGFGK